MFLSILLFISSCNNKNISNNKQCCYVELDSRIKGILNQYIQINENKYGKTYFYENLILLELSTVYDSSQYKLCLKLDIVSYQLGNPNIKPVYYTQIRGVDVLIFTGFEVLFKSFFNKTEFEENTIASYDTNFIYSLGFERENIKPNSSVIIIDDFEKNNYHIVEDTLIPKINLPYKFNGVVKKSNNIIPLDIENASCYSIEYLNKKKYTLSKKLKKKYVSCILIFIFQIKNKKISDFRLKKIYAKSKKDFGYYNNIKNLDDEKLSYDMNELWPLYEYLKLYRDSIDIRVKDVDCLDSLWLLDTIKINISSESEFLNIFRLEKL